MKRSNRNNVRMMAEADGKPAEAGDDKKKGGGMRNPFAALGGKSSHKNLRNTKTSHKQVFKVDEHFLLTFKFSCFTMFLRYEEHDGCDEESARVFRKS